MAQTLFSNVDCWLQHMALDEKTGLDKQGINLRAATGLEAVDYFVPGYAVWAKMVQALGDIGYDSNNLVSSAFPFKLHSLSLKCHTQGGCPLSWDPQATVCC